MTKDFILDCDGDDAATASNNGNGNGNGNGGAPLSQRVPTVLLYGLEALVPLLSADLLRNFPLTADRYFSFVAFVLGAYQEEFAGLVLSDQGGGLDTGGGTGAALLSTLVQVRRWCALPGNASAPLSVAHVQARQPALPPAGASRWTPAQATCPRRWPLIRPLADPYLTPYPALG